MDMQFNHVRKVGCPLLVFFQNYIENTPCLIHYSIPLLLSAVDHYCGPLVTESNIIFPLCRLLHTFPYLIHSPVSCMFKPVTLPQSCCVQLSQPLFYGLESSNWHYSILVCGEPLFVKLVSELFCDVWAATWVWGGSFSGGAVSSGRVPSGP